MRTNHRWNMADQCLICNIKRILRFQDTYVYEINGRIEQRRPQCDRKASRSEILPPDHSKEMKMEAGKEYQITITVMEKPGVSMVGYHYDPEIKLKHLQTVVEFCKRSMEQARVKARRRGIHDEAEITKFCEAATFETIDGNLNE